MTSPQVPPVLFESRISELEAQLTQNRIELKKAFDENEAIRRSHLAGEDGSVVVLKREIDTLLR